MDVDFIADYQFRIKSTDQDPLTDNEFKDLAEHLASFIKLGFIAINGEPPGGFVEVVLMSAMVNGNPLNGVSNAQ